MPDVCPYCCSPVEEHVSHDAPFLMFGCGTRKWRKGSFGRAIQSPECLRKVEAGADVDHFQEEHRPVLPPGENEPQEI
jgi:hypothetical protein